MGMLDASSYRFFYFPPCSTKTRKKKRKFAKKSRKKQQLLHFSHKLIFSKRTKDLKRRFLNLPELLLFLTLPQCCRRFLQVEGVGNTDIQQILFACYLFFEYCLK